MSWLLVLGLATALMVVSIAWITFRRRGRHRWVASFGLGLALTLAAISAGGWVISVKNPLPDEPRGVGVLVWREDGRAATGSGTDLVVTSALDVRGCGQMVKVRLTVTPTVEFWQRRWKALSETAVVGVAIPDATVTDVAVQQETDGLRGLVDPSVTLVPSKDLPEPRIDRRAEADVTIVEFDVPGWGRTNLPVSVTFSADWTSDSSRWAPATSRRRHSSASRPR